MFIFSQNDIIQDRVTEKPYMKRFYLLSRT